MRTAIDLPATGGAVRVHRSAEVRGPRPLLAGVLAAGAFVAIQVVLLLIDHVHIQRAVADGTVRYPPEALSFLLASQLSQTIPVFAGLSFGAVMLARRGWRLMWAAPGLAFVLLPWLLHGFNASLGTIGYAWWFESGNGASTWTVWAGPFVDLGLALTPAALVVRSARGAARPRRMDVPGLAALVTCMAAIFLVQRTTAIVNGFGPDLSLTVCVAILGFGLGAPRWRWPWAHLLFVAAVGGMLSGVLYPLAVDWFSASPGEAGSVTANAAYAAVAGMPLAMIVLLASAQDPFGRLLGRLEATPLILLIAVNVLNLADAVLTAVAVRAGDAVELNPVIRIVGLPAKLVLVGALSWMLYRRRSRALIWPAAALLSVLAYHVSGVVVNG